jgi:hypothetical protein
LEIMGSSVVNAGRSRATRNGWLAGTESGPQKTRAEIETRNPARKRGWNYAWAAAGGACSKMRALTNGEATQTGCNAGRKAK